MNSYIKTFLSDPAIIALVLTNLVVAWSLMASHFGSDKLARRSTFFAVFPLIALLCWVGYLKITSDAIVMSRQQEIISNLDSRAKKINDDLGVSSAKIQDINTQVSTMKEQVSEVKQVIEDLKTSVANATQAIKTGVEKVNSRVQTMDDRARQAEKCRQQQEQELREYQHNKELYPQMYKYWTFQPRPCR